MPINDGKIELYVAVGDEGGVTATIYYNPNVGLDANGDPDPALQPIRNVNGAALRVVNTSTREAFVEVSGPSGPFLGDDGTRVLKIPTTGITATAAQLRNRAGIQTRADVGEFSLSSPEGLRKA